MIEGDRLVPVGEQPLVENVEHLEKGHLGGDVVELVVDERTVGTLMALAPDAQVEFHYL